MSAPNIETTPIVNAPVGFAFPDGQTPGAPMNLDVNVSALAMTNPLYNGRVVTLNRAAGQAIVLPAATGSGALYTFIVGTTITSNTTTIKVANTTDAFQGFSMVVSDNSAAVLGYRATAGTDDTVTLNGSTTGGFAGDLITVRDVAAGRFDVKIFGAGTGTEATPFSATV